MESVSFVGGKKKLSFISDSTAEFNTTKKGGTGFYVYVSSLEYFNKWQAGSVSAQTYWGHWMPSTAVTKERPNSVPRNTLAGDEWYRKKKNSLTFGARTSLQNCYVF